MLTPFVVRVNAYFDNTTEIVITRVQPARL
jgi:hypothetical protein